MNIYYNIYVISDYERLRVRNRWLIPMFKRLLNLTLRDGGLEHVE